MIFIANVQFSAMHAKLHWFGNWHIPPLKGCLLSWPCKVSLHTSIVTVKQLDIGYTTLGTVGQANIQRHT